MPHIRMSSVAWEIIITHSLVIVYKALLTSRTARGEIGDPICSTHRFIDCRVALAVKVA